MRFFFSWVTMPIDVAIVWVLLRQPFVGDTISEKFLVFCILPSFSPLFYSVPRVINAGVLFYVVSISVRILSSIISAWCPVVIFSNGHQLLYRETYRRNCRVCLEIMFVYQSGSCRLSSNIHDLTHLLVKFRVEDMISLLLSTPSVQSDSRWVLTTYGCHSCTLRVFFHAGQFWGS